MWAMDMGIGVIHACITLRMRETRRQPLLEKYPRGCCSLILRHQNQGNTSMECCDDSTGGGRKASRNGQLYVGDKLTENRLTRIVWLPTRYHRQRVCFRKGWEIKSALGFICGGDILSFYVIIREGVLFLADCCCLMFLRLLNSCGWEVSLIIIMNESLPCHFNYFAQCPT